MVEEKSNASVTSSQIGMASSRLVDHPELSLGPFLSSQAEGTDDLSSELESNNCRKRKLAFWEETTTQTNIDLNLNNPLPIDWEQCLDLHSGRMYFLNRKTSKKSWARPKEQNVDLELNISTLPTLESSMKKDSQASADAKKQSSSNSSMAAIICVNCHLLVMVCRSMPSCPNCKHMHSLLPPSMSKMEADKTLETLSLLH